MNLFRWVHLESYQRRSLAPVVSWHNSKDMTQEEKLNQELERQAFSKKTKQIYTVWYKQLCAYYKDIKPEI